MKRLLFSLIGLFLILTMTGCFLFLNIKEPLPYASYYGEGAGSWEKMGEASCTSYLGIITTGDASIKAAMENGGIRKIHHIDYQVTSILGIIVTYKTIVYGE